MPSVDCLGWLVYEVTHPQQHSGSQVILLLHLLPPPHFLDD